MANSNWLVTDDGNHRPFGDPETLEPGRYYRLYRFLTELEDILDTFHDDLSRLEAITPLVRKLLVSSYWLQMEYKNPDPATGWSVNFLYREHEFPITVQMVTWLPGHKSTIHNHGTWGIVALVGGQERNRIWRRAPQPGQPDRIELVDEIILNPGDVVALTANAIHSVEPLGEEPTVSFNLYGVTNFSDRREFDVENHSAKPF
ncbi:MAG: cupin [Shackletoniella antarctica]|jgi:predicted metal-dependent enzyme (double-stranded beta helix superfamily)|uniref:Cupin n=1 Tax=Shackletoniella antarctica TaxID=268115 RepID=A0A2W4WMJ9_9CYAN|nr:MAG: cupin [Shackletoniella antarctica]